MIKHIHGARWWKFDFHSHTPASDDFGKGDTEHKAITPENWLLMYMNAEIDCVAITDHNSGEWIDILKTTLQVLDETQPTEYRKLFLFPGVEITASNNIHILALFDPSTGTKEVQALLGAVNFPTDKFGTSDATSPKSVEEIISKIHKRGGIAIPAHVDEACGLFKLTGHTFSQALKVEELLAIEVINKTKEKPELYKQSKLQLAEIVGSDSHIAAQVGSNYTWVKMSDPSLDALRLALHDCEDGVIRKDECSHDPNIINNRYFIKSISISDGFKAGNGTPLSAKFSPWLSSVIGGRGSGKSTIINYLRIALNRIVEMPDDIQSEFNRFNQIGKKSSPGMLRDSTTIKVEIFKDGKLHLLTWNQQTHSLQTWDDSTANWGIATIVSNISELFPIQIFSQKELYALTGNPSKLIELIDSQFDKQSWLEAKEKLIEKWLADRTKARHLQAAISEEQNLKAQLDSTNNKIQLYESSDYKDTLGDFNKLTAVNGFFSNTTGNISQFISELEELNKKAPNIQMPEGVSDALTVESTQFLQTVENTMSGAILKIKEAIALLAPYKEDLQSQFNALPWFAEFEAAKSAYEAILDKIQELGSESYEILIQRRNSLSGRLALIDTQKTQLQTLKSELQTLYTSIIEKEKELRIKRKSIIDRWKEFDNAENPFLIIELHPMSDVDNANATFRKLLRKEGSEFAGYIYSHDDETDNSTGLISTIINEAENTRWEKRFEAVKNFVSATETDTKGLDLRLARHITWLNQNTPEDIDRLLVWIPEDKLILRFKKQGREEDIQTGSAGERTAGMLGLLLALNNIPLIIDQPEDDLDTRLISTFVVPGFKALKQKRQLLLVTHNPNIAVNANSDSIVYMNFSSGQIAVDGNDALQNKDIRLAVCNVMEGGKEALYKRYYRISKALK
ncbi:MAG: AAA family ATPase [Chitinophagaceae bacterium]|nr:AAA family ATPase [Chitinophagaceae bacterium]MCW5927563.1 AAA family ATPase [Chitinophagaceae bacterium]